MAIALRPEPRIIQRRCGGFLALSTSTRAPKIGVTADTEEEAREKLNAALGRWLEILDEATDNPAILRLEIRGPE
jgi:hypothetical protein